MLPKALTVLRGRRLSSHFDMHNELNSARASSLRRLRYSRPVVIRYDPPLAITAPGNRLPCEHCWSVLGVRHSIGHLIARTPGNTHRLPAIARPRGSPVGQGLSGVRAIGFSRFARRQFDRAKVQGYINPSPCPDNSWKSSPCRYAIDTGVTEPITAYWIRVQHPMTASRPIAHEHERILEIHANRPPSRSAPQKASAAARRNEDASMPGGSRVALAVECEGAKSPSQATPHHFAGAAAE